jgi:RNA polymerase sigma-54 factor
MQMNLSMQMKMSQQMRLAPRMIQSMEILQLPIMALNERIEQELLENAVLEQVAAVTEVSETEAQVELEKAREEASAPEVDQKELVVDNDHDNEADFQRLVEMAEQWPEDNVSSGSRPSSGSAWIVALSSSQ